MIVRMKHCLLDASWLTAVAFSMFDSKVCGLIVCLSVDNLPLKKVCLYVFMC